MLKIAGFSQAIHIFFSSKKNVNRLKKICTSLGTVFVLFRHVAFSFPNSSASTRQTFSY